MRILITGVSGYVARVTLPYLLDDKDVSMVSGLDIRPPGFEHPKFAFIEGDIRDYPLESVMKGVDVVAHLAFIVGEIRDKEKTYDINVNGTRRVLDAVKAAGIRRLVVASSISAYGSHPRDAKPITEETPLDGNADSYYSQTKRIMEGMLDEFEKANPHTTVTRLRPSILCGAQTDNFFLDLLRQPVIPYPSSNMLGLPLVHEDDVGRAFHLAIKKSAPGAFNVAAGNLSFKRLGEILGRWTFGVPSFFLKPTLDIGFKIGLSPMSSHWLVLGRYPFNMSCEKAKKMLGWTPRYSPEEAFNEMVAAWKKK